MAKLQHTFVQGKMNKDLDERLVPNGQYRDAQNVQVSTSESSDVGAVENILGNTVRNLRSTSPNAFWQTGFGLTNPVCIGVVKDSQNEKIYWFLSAPDSSTDAIVEFDQVTGIVAPILVDVNGVLNFNKLNLITGVNILEGLLYWTDDRNEPRVINIATFKAGSTTFAAQTHVYGASRDFINTDITVMTPTPLTALTVTTVPSLVGGFGTGITPISTNVVNFGGKEVGNVVAFSWTSQPITWSGATNPRVILTASVTQEDGIVDQYQVTGVFGGGSGLSAGGGALTIESISQDTPDSSLVWSMILIEDEPIYKNDFPRFSYRYKYTDGRFSVYAPFSLAAFVPGKFEYLSRDGNNEGMKDVIRKITLSAFPLIPVNVAEIEVLYKGSQSPTIYLIESFSYDFSTNPQPVLTLDIISGTLGRVIESSQLLRLFDNVPQKAKAQEIIGNRIIYGNYLQNYDVPNASIAIEASQTNSAHTNVNFGIPTVKTDREYQLGVSFLDSFGRESPVFTSNGGSISFNQENAKKINVLKGKLKAGFPAPSWASYFKFYIKNITPPYYNIALDRYYSAQDGSVWLSFPSSERNKLMEGQYIRLKKQHDTSIPVTINNRYKITGIENQAPDYLTNVKSVLARINGLSYNTVSPPGFAVGNPTVQFLGPLLLGNENFHKGFNITTYIQFLNGNGGGSSAIYSILEGGPTGAEVEVALDPSSPDDKTKFAVFEAVLSRSLKSEDIWLTNLSTTANVPIKAVLWQDQYQPLAEFQGRFFVKINPNATFTQSVIAAFADNKPELVLNQTLNIVAGGAGVVDNETLAIWNDAVFAGAGSVQLPSVSASSNQFKIAFADFNYPGQNSDPTVNILSESLVEGATIKFKYSDGTSSFNFYTIINKFVSTTSYQRQNVNILGTIRQLSLNRNYNDTQFGGEPTGAQITGIEIFRARYKNGQEILSSNNPAIFETEPEEIADIDLFYEASNAIAIGDASALQTLSWFNAYSFGNGVESDRIRDDFNAPTLGKGVRVSSTIEEPYRQERLGSSMIFSGIFNSISGVNDTNQFLTAENITKNLNPTYGTIQKLHARDTDLVVLKEDKCFRILADKNALYNADGSTNVTSSNNVLGQAVPFVGEYGISKNPESFASFGFRTYFTDKSRGVVLRLSRDGLTDISDKSMSSFFQDGLRTNVNPSIIGSYDTVASSYNIVIGGEGVSFKEGVDGWNTRMSYNPEAGISLNNEYYTFKLADLYKHTLLNDYVSPPAAVPRSNFYGVQGNTTVTAIFNDAPTSIKNFKTLSYEGDAGWAASVVTNAQSGTVSTWKEREGIYFNYIMGDDTTLANIDTKEFSVQGIGNMQAAMAVGAVDMRISGEINVSLQAGDIIYSTNGVVSPAQLRTIGTVSLVDRVNNTIRLVATVPNLPPNPNPVMPAVNDFMLFAKNSQVNTSGLLGYQATVKMTTNSGTKKELFAVNSEVFISSE